MEIYNHKISQSRFHTRFPIKMNGETSNANNARTVHPKNLWTQYSPPKFGQSERGGEISLEPSVPEIWAISKTGSDVITLYW